MFCRLCGQEIPADVNRCPCCGAAVRRPAAPAAADPFDNPAHSSPRQEQPTGDRSAPTIDLGRVGIHGVQPDELPPIDEGFAPRGPEPRPCGQTGPAVPPETAWPTGNGSPEPPTPEPFYRDWLEDFSHPDSPSDPPAPAHKPRRTEQAGRKKERPQWLIPVIAAGVTALLLIVMLVVFLLVDNTGEPEETQPSEAVTEPTEAPTQPTEPPAPDSPAEVASRFEDENGCVPADRVSEALNAVYEAALSMEGVRSCNLEQDCVYIDMDSGLDYIYFPRIAGLDAGSGPLEILTIQPERGWIGQQDSSADQRAADDAAAMLSGWDSRWSFPGGNNLDDSAVTAERLLTLDRASLILLHGHGIYSTHRGYAMATGIFGSPEFLAANRQFNDRTAVQSLNHEIYLTTDFFGENYDDDAFENAFIYIATCHSGTDAELAELLLEKEAAVVITNRGAISRSYNLNMMRVITDSFFSCGTSRETAAWLEQCTELKDVPAADWSIQDSLRLAQAVYGEKDTAGGPGHQASVILQTAQREPLCYPQWMEEFELELEPPVRLAFDQSFVSTRKDTVYDERTENPSVSEEKRHYYRLPLIGLSSGDAEAVNDQIEELFEDDARSHSSSHTGWQWVDYESYVNQDILSLMVKAKDEPSGSWTFWAWNFSLRTGKLLTGEELLSAAGWSSGSFEKYVKENLLSRYWTAAWTWMEDEIAGTPDDPECIAPAEFAFNQTLQDCSAAIPYLAENRALYLAAAFHYPEGHGDKAEVSREGVTCPAASVTRPEHYAEQFVHPDFPDPAELRAEHLTAWLDSYKPEAGYQIKNTATADVTGDGLPELIVVIAADTAYQGIVVTETREHTMKVILRERGTIGQEGFCWYLKKSGGSFHLVREYLAQVPGSEYALQTIEYHLENDGTIREDQKLTYVPAENPEEDQRAAYTAQVKELLTGCTLLGTLDTGSTAPSGRSLP